MDESVRLLMNAAAEKALGYQSRFEAVGPRRMRWTLTFITGLMDLANFLNEELGTQTTGVEIGCFAGESTFIFASEMNLVRLYCVDLWRPNRKFTSETMAAAEAHFDSMVAKAFPFVVKCKRSSAKFFAHPPSDKVRFVYIDGNHSYESVKADIIGARRIVQPGGYICGHDYGWPNGRFAGVTRAVDTMLGKPDMTFCDQSWLKSLGREQRVVAT